MNNPLLNEQENREENKFHPKLDSIDEDNQNKENKKREELNDSLKPSTNDNNDSVLSNPNNNKHNNSSFRRKKSRRDSNWSLLGEPNEKDEDLTDNNSKINESLISENEDVDKLFREDIYNTINIDIRKEFEPLSLDCDLSNNIKNLVKHYNTIVESTSSFSEILMKDLEKDIDFLKTFYEENNEFSNCLTRKMRMWNSVEQSRKDNLQMDDVDKKQEYHINFCFYEIKELLLKEIEKQKKNDYNLKEDDLATELSFFKDCINETSEEIKTLVVNFVREEIKAITFDFNTGFCDGQMVLINFEKKLKEKLEQIANLRNSITSEIKKSKPDYELLLEQQTEYNNNLKKSIIDGNKYLKNLHDLKVKEMKLLNARKDRVRNKISKQNDVRIYLSKEIKSIKEKYIEGKKKLLEIKSKNRSIVYNYVKSVMSAIESLMDAIQQKSLKACFEIDFLKGALNSEIVSDDDFEKLVYEYDELSKKICYLGNEESEQLKDCHHILLEFNKLFNDEIKGIITGEKEVKVNYKKIEQNYKICFEKIHEVLSKINDLKKLSEDINEELEVDKKLKKKLQDNPAFYVKKCYDKICKDGNIIKEGYDALSSSCATGFAGDKLGSSIFSHYSNTYVPKNLAQSLILSKIQSRAQSRAQNNDQSLFMSRGVYPPCMNRDNYNFEPKNLRKTYANWDDMGGKHNFPVSSTPFTGRNKNNRLMDSSAFFNNNKEPENITLPEETFGQEQNTELSTLIRTGVEGFEYKEEDEDPLRGKYNEKEIMAAKEFNNNNREESFKKLDSDRSLGDNLFTELKETEKINEIGQKLEEREQLDQEIIDEILYTTLEEEKEEILRQNEEFKTIFKDFKCIEDAREKTQKSVNKFSINSMKEFSEKNWPCVAIGSLIVFIFILFIIKLIFCRKKNITKKIKIN